MTKLGLLRDRRIVSTLSSFYAITGIVLFRLNIFESLWMPIICSLIGWFGIIAYYSDNRSVMKIFECCGRQSYRDWTKVPPSCCINNHCPDYYSDGCVKAISRVGLYSLIIYEIVIIGFTTLHVFAMKAAFALARAFVQESDRCTNEAIVSDV